MEAATKQMALAVCTGCDIGKCIDTDRLIDAAGKVYQGITCIKHGSLCSPDGQAGLKRTVLENRVDRLAVAACSPRVWNSAFEVDGVLVERINLREQLAWVMEPGHEDTQLCAEDQVAMALSGLDAIRTNDPYIPDPISSDILVVGGGIAGLTSALEGARAGYRVHLVERSDRLGGYAGRIHKLLPDHPDAASLKEPDLHEVIREVTEHPCVDLHLETNIRSISGEPGNFQVVMENSQVSELAHRCSGDCHGVETLYPGEACTTGIWFRQGEDPGGI